ncbi:aspartate racemase [Clostridia bacterium]|nr:aspartate racemase [Clostridia bacterium]
MRTLGVIGGMGPEATARFYELFTTLDDAACDQDRPDAIIISRPSIPDRTRHLLGLSGDDPAPHIVQAAQQLAAMGADCAAIPCLTSHCYLPRILPELKLPLIDMVKATTEAVAQRRVGLLATDGTVQTGLFAALDPILPGADGQRQLMKIIYEQLKTRKSPFSVDALLSIADELFESGAEVVLLGCTELSLAARDPKIGGDTRFVDPLKLLARRALAFCKEE